MDSQNQQQNSNLDIKLKRTDRVYRPNEFVEGAIVVYCKNGWTHKGLKLKSTGTVHLNSTRPGAFGAEDIVAKQIEIFCYETDLVPPGKYDAGTFEVPYSFVLRSNSNPNTSNDQNPQQPLLESYHGVYVSVIYLISVECDRGMLKKALTKEMEFCVEIPASASSKPVIDVSSSIMQSVTFDVTPDTLKNVNPKYLSVIPKFRITGSLHRSRFLITQPFTGEMTLRHAATAVRTIELQLVRVETVCIDGKTITEASEVQNIQICDGDVCRDAAVPLYMVFPRLYACPTVPLHSFSYYNKVAVEFEVNLILVFVDGYMVTENFPISIARE